MAQSGLKTGPIGMHFALFLLHFDATRVPPVVVGFVVKRTPLLPRRRWHRLVHYVHMPTHALSV